MTGSRPVRILVSKPRESRPKKNNHKSQGRHNLTTDGEKIISRERKEKILFDCYLIFDISFASMKMAFNFKTGQPLNWPTGNLAAYGFTFFPTRRI
ncbi:MAG TPA: hypothetical protein DCW97_06065 [Acidobacteria bacterium]|nr:hypothetical protein [Acidobacteriota bacterium]